MKIRIVRVAVGNNFNCTQVEYNQLVELDKHSHCKNLFFVNANIKALNNETVENVNNNNYPIVITANPDIIVNRDDVARINNVRKDRIAFVRVKYVPGRQDILDLIQHFKSLGIRTIVTIQRFKKWETAGKFVAPEYQYQYQNLGTGFLRLQKKYYPKNVGMVCDRKGKGCQECGLCSKLTYGVNEPLYSVNLSTSGKCPYNCPDCFSKIAQQRSLGKILFDRIKQNAKQAGTQLYNQDVA